MQKIIKRREWDEPILMKDEMLTVRIDGKQSLLTKHSKLGWTLHTEPRPFTPTFGGWVMEVFPSHMEVAKATKAFGSAEDIFNIWYGTSLRIPFDFPQ